MSALQTIGIASSVPRHLDQTIHDKLDAYRAYATNLKQTAQVAQAAEEALEQRVQVLTDHANTADAAAAQATQNLVAAWSTLQALNATRRLSEEARSHAEQSRDVLVGADGMSTENSTEVAFAESLPIEAPPRVGLYQQTHTLADQLRETSALMEALEADIAQAVSKNGMPSFVKDRAADALTACRLAASAALACLADTAQAMSAAEQSHHAAKALPAALVRLEHAMQGYSIDAESSLLGIPRTVEYAIAAPPAADPDSKDNPAAMGDKPSFALTLDKYLDARSALTRKSHAPGDKSRAGMLDGFGQVFQILGRVKQLALEGKSTAEGDLVRAVQTLEDMLAKADEADQRLQAAERAVLT